jgi:hypothetical protein
MNRRLKLFTSLVGLIIVAALLTIFLVRDPTSTTFDLRDGTQLEIVRISFSTNHIAHFGTVPQKVLFKIVGARLSEKWVGSLMVTPSQDSRNGNLGIFVIHRFDLSGDTVENLHNYKIKPVSLPHEGHPMFLSSGQGLFGLWELNYWTENHSDFLVENSKGETVGRFQLTKDTQGRFSIRSNSIPKM